MTTRKEKRAKRLKAATEARYAASPKGAYAHAKARAKHRGVEFTLTFDQWWAVWHDSGHWAERGNRAGQYNMMRRGDTGAYAPGNVYIGTHEANVAERNAMVAIRRHTARSTSVTWVDPLQLEGSTVTRLDYLDDCPF